METQTQMGNLIPIQIQEVRPIEHVTKSILSVFTGSSLRSSGRKVSSATSPGLAYHHACSARPFLKTPNAGTD